MSHDLTTTAPNKAEVPICISLSPLELHVLLMLWQGAHRQEIADAIRRTPRQVSRITKQITTKLGTFDPQLLLYRLEDELFRRIPAMQDRDLIAALKLYRTTFPSSPAKPTSTISNKDVQSLLKEVLPHGDAHAAATE